MMRLDRCIETRWICRPVAMALLAAAAAATPARAGEVVNMRYDVEIAGTRIMQIAYHVDLDKTGYQSTLDAESRGILDLFSSINLDMKGSGRIDGSQLAPRSFEMGSSKRGKDRQVSVTWTSDRLPLAKRSFALKDGREKDIAAHLNAGIADPLTALLKQGVLAGARPCTGTERVFNGEEVYDLAFSVDKPDTFASSDGGVYRGPALKCLVTYRPVAGLSDKKMQKLRKDPPQFNIWFAPVASRSMGTLYVPVAVAGKLKGNVFTALATRATLAGAPLNAKSLASQ